MARGQQPCAQVLQIEVLLPGAALLPARACASRVILTA